MEHFARRQTGRRRLDNALVPDVVGRIDLNHFDLGNRITLSIHAALIDTGEEHLARRQTGRRRLDNAFVPNVVGRIDLDRFGLGRALALSIHAGFNRTGIEHFALSHTGSRLGFNAGVPLVTQRVNHFLRNQRFSASRAVAAFRQAGIHAVRSNRRIRYRRMALLLDQHVAANRTGLRSGTGSFGARRMAQRINNLLRLQDRIANRAVHALRQAGAHAVGRNRHIRYRRMSLLLDQHFAANRTGLRSGTGGFGARRMAQRVNHFLRNQRFAASRAVAALRQAGIHAVRSNRRIRYRRMSLLLGQHFAANRTGLRSGTGGFGARRMAQRIYYILRHNRFTTDRAVLTFGQTSFGTGRHNRRINHLSMTQRSNNIIRINVAAGRAGIGRIAVRRTGRRSYLALILMAQRRLERFITHRTDLRSCAGGFGARGMAQRRRFFLRNQHFSANAAMRAGRQTSLCTGSRNSSIRHSRMIDHGDHFLLQPDCTAGIAVFTGRQTGSRTGRRNICILYPLMAQRVDDILRLCRAAGRAGIGRIAARRAGRRSYNAFTISVSQRIHIRINICIITLGADMRSVALLRTGGRSHSAYMVMTGRSYTLILVRIITGGADMRSIAVRRTGGRSYSAYIVMAGRIYIRIHVRITTRGADMRSIALLRTGGRSHSAFIAMAECIYIRIHIRIITLGAGMRGIALLRTGGRGHSALVLMLQRRNDLGGLVVQPDFADRTLRTAGTAFLAALGRNRLNNSPAMLQRSDFLRFEAIAVLAVAALFARYFTGSFLRGIPRTKDVGHGRNFLRIGLLTDSALQLGDAAIRTYRCLIGNNAIFVLDFHNADRFFRQLPGMITSRGKGPNKFLIVAYRALLVYSAIHAAVGILSDFFTQLMAGRRNHTGIIRAANRALEHRRTIFSTAGGHVLTVFFLHADRIRRQHPGMFAGSRQGPNKFLIVACRALLVYSAVHAAVGILSDFFTQLMAGRRNRLGLFDAAGAADKLFRSFLGTGRLGDDVSFAPGMLSSRVGNDRLDGMVFGSFITALTGVHNVAVLGAVNRLPAVFFAVGRIGGSNYIIMAQCRQFRILGNKSAHATNARMARLRTGSSLITIFIPLMAGRLNHFSLGMGRRILSGAAGILTGINNLAVFRTGSSHPHAVLILFSAGSNARIVGMLQHVNGFGENFVAVCAIPRLYALSVAGGLGGNLPLFFRNSIPFMAQHRQNGAGSFSTVNAIVPLALVFHQTSRHAGSILSGGFNAHVVLNLSGHIRNRPGIAIRAVHAAFAIARGIAGRFHSLGYSIAMGNCLNHILLDDDRAAGLAVAAFGQAGLSTGRRLRRIGNDIGMRIKRRNHCIPRLSTTVILALIDQRTGLRAISQRILAVFHQLYAAGLSDLHVMIRTIRQHGLPALSTGLVPLTPFNQQTIRTAGSRRAGVFNKVMLNRIAQIASCPHLTVFTLRSAFRIANLIAGRRLALFICDDMDVVIRINRQHLIRRHFSAAADRAVLIFRPACLNTGRRLTRHSHHGMRNGHYFLLHQHLAAGGAVLALGQAGFGTGGRLRLIDHLGVAQCSYYVLRNQHLAADGAVLAFRQTGFGTGGILRRIDHFVVARRRNFLVSRIIALRAVFVRFITGFRTGSILGLYLHQSVLMIRRRNYYLSSVITILTVLILIVTIFRTGSRLGIHLQQIMPFRILDQFAANRTGLRGRTSCLSAGRMAKRSYYSLRHSNRAASSTVLTFGQACRGAGRRNRLIDHFGMALRSYYFLLHQHLAADRAVFALGQAGFSTGGRLRSIDHFGMAECINFSLRDRNFITNSTLFALGLALFSAGRSNSSNRFFLMAQRRRFFLRLQHFITYRAMLTLGLTFRGAGSVYRRIDHFGMAQRVYYSLRHNRFTADRAVLAFGQASFGAGRRLRLINYFGMTLCGHYFLCHQHFITYRAMLALGLTFRGTGSVYRRVYHFGMAQRSNFFLRDRNFTTNSTLFALGLALFSAGRSNSSNRFFLMTQRRRFFLRNQNSVTGRAMLAFRLTGRGTGRRNRSIGHFGMAQRSYYSLRHSNRAASSTVLTFGQASFGAGRRNRSIGHFGMPQRSYLIRRIRIAASGASIGRIALLGTGRRSYHAIIVAMAFCISQFLSTNRTGLRSSTCRLSARRMARRRSQFLSTNCTGLRGRTSCLSAGRMRQQLAFRVATTLTRCKHSTGCRSHIMAQRIYYLLRLNRFSTDRAVLTFGQTGRGTGRRNRSIGHFSVASRSLNNLATNRTGLRGRTSRRIAGRMAERSNFFLRDQNGVTGRAMLALRLTGSGTGRSDRCIGYFGVAQSRNNLLCRQHLATNSTLLAVRQAGFGTGSRLAGNRFFSMAKRRSFIIGIGTTTNCTSISGIALSRTSRCSYHTCIIRMLLCRHRLATNDTRSCIRTSGTLRTNMLRAYPLASSVSIGNSGFAGMLTSLHISTIRILQLGRGQQDFGIARALHQLMSDSLRARCTDCYFTSLYTGNIRTTSSCICRTCRYINCTVNLNSRILTHIMTTSFAGCISNHLMRSIGTVRINKVTPLVSVIDIDIATAGQGTLRTFFNDNFRTRQHGDILPKCNRFTALDRNCNIAVNRQFIILGIN